MKLSEWLKRLIERERVYLNKCPYDDPDCRLMHRCYECAAELAW